MSSRTSVDKAPARCSGGPGFHFRRGTQIFLLCVTLMTVWLFHLLSFFIFLGWKKHSKSPSWCTISAERTLLSSSSLCPIDHRDCQKLCDDRPGCDAVEFWENHNYACFQCSSTSFVKSYTDTKDLAYPVYVWVRGKQCINLRAWFKLHSLHFWITDSHGSLFSTK